MAEAVLDTCSNSVSKLSMVLGLSGIDSFYYSLLVRYRCSPATTWAVHGVLVVDTFLLLLIEAVGQLSLEDFNSFRIGLGIISMSGLLGSYSYRQKSVSLG